jgi:ATP-dependent Clp protease protease subunit
LKALGEVSALDVHINSEGGDVFAGSAIFTMLRNVRGPVTAYVDGLAASAASMIAMAASRVVMPANAMMMVHMPWSLSAGNAADLRKHADMLDRVGEAMMAAYMAKTGMAEDDMRALLEEETWMTAEKAHELGFADEVQKLARVSASVRPDGLVEVNGQVMDLSRFARKPESIPAFAQADELPAADTTVAASDTVIAPDEMERRQRIVRTLKLRRMI